jgi:triosephosphate isomerase
MRKKFIAGNWKMNLNSLQASDLAAAIATSVASASDVEVAIFPPAVYLEAVVGAVHGSAVGVGAQNCHHEAKGAFTGEVAPAMLVDIGCKYVILGHSERRQIFHETNADVNKKTLAALASGLTPIVCVGEALAERQAGNTSKVVREQVEGSLAGISADQLLKLVIAYEPIWAIGTGVVATPEQAEEVHADLRSLLSSRYTAPIAEQVRIQYGGSVNAENAATLLSQPNIDGALVGGASLKADGFLAIIQGARK